MSTTKHFYGLNFNKENMRSNQKFIKIHNVQDWSNDGWLNGSRNYSHWKWIIELILTMKRASAKWSREPCPIERNATNHQPVIAEE